MADLAFESVAFESMEFESASLETPVDRSAENTGDVEADCKRELGELEKGFVDRARNEQARFQKATDSEYWVCLCFQTREEVEQFIARAGIGKGDEKYLDGRAVAKKLGVEIEQDNTPYGKPKIYKTWAAMARHYEEAKQ